MQNAAIEMHWLMVNHVSRLKKAEKPKMLVWRTEFGRGVFFGGKLNKPCGYWFCQKWLLIISKRPKKSSEWCYFNLTPPTDHGTILRRSPPGNIDNWRNPHLSQYSNTCCFQHVIKLNWWVNSKYVHEKILCMSLNYSNISYTEPELLIFTLIQCLTIQASTLIINWSVVLILNVWNIDIAGINPWCRWDSVMLLSIRRGPARKYQR